MLFLGPVSEAVFALALSDQIIHGDPGLVKKLRNVYCGNQEELDEEAKETQTYCKQILQQIPEPESASSAEQVTVEVDEDELKNSTDRHRDFLVKMAALDVLDTDEREVERHERLMATCASWNTITQGTH